MIHFADDLADAIMAVQPDLFDLLVRYGALRAAGNTLERLSAVVDLEIFRGPLVPALRCRLRGTGGRPPFDVLSIRYIMESFLTTENWRSISVIARVKG